MMAFVLMCVISCNDLFMGSDAKTAMPTDVWPVAVSHVSDGGLCRKSYVVAGAGATQAVLQ